MIGQALVRVDLDKIRLGATCRFDISDNSGLLLLGSGQPLTESVRDQIQSRNVSYLEVHPDDVDALLGKSKPKVVSTAGSPTAETFVSRRIDRRHEPYSAERAERFTSIVSDAIQRVAGVGDLIQSLSAGAVSELCEIPEGMTLMALEDADQAVATIDQMADLSVAQRCARLAVLAINTGIEMELSDSEVGYLGTAGLLHDMGLFLMPEAFRSTTRALSNDEAWEFRKHPTIAKEIFAKYSMIPDEVRVIIDQVHERIDGSGYPRGLHSNLIHPLSRVLNLLDTYLSLVSPGPGRPAVLPHDAISFLLHEGGRGRFDVAPMRALLSTVSLFPIGSSVALSNGKTATVIRRDGDHYAEPIVQTDNEGEVEKIAIKDSSLSIVRPIVTAEQSQMRLTPEMAQTFTLELLEP